MHLPEQVSIKFISIFFEVQDRPRLTITVRVDRFKIPLVIRTSGGNDTECTVKATHQYPTSTNHRVLVSEPLDLGVISHTFQVGINELTKPIHRSAKSLIERTAALQGLPDVHERTLIDSARIDAVTYHWTSNLTEIQIIEFFDA